MSQKRLLISYAHPDDESFANGGLIAKYVAEGVDVFLICATDGDVGTIPDEMQGQYDSIRELRLAELECANQVLNFKQIFLLNYKDSGMMGSETTKDEACLWYNWQNNSEQVTRRVVEVIREIRPQVIITFNKYGGYGHPDHIAIQQATTEAFTLAANTEYITDGLQAYQPQKLYHSSIPSIFLKIMLFIMKLRGMDTKKMGRNQDINFDAVFDNIEPTHTKIDIADYLEIWDAAAACHKSQGGGGAGFFRRFPMWLRRHIQGTQSLTRVYPAPQHNHIDEYDLFENVVISEPVAEQI